jgi:hypothetical protein
MMSSENLDARIMKNGALDRKMLTLEALKGKWSFQEVLGEFWNFKWLDVTPTFCKNKFFCANRSAYKNAYKIIVLVKNFQKKK